MGTFSMPVTDCTEIVLLGRLTVTIFTAVHEKHCRVPKVDSELYRAVNPSVL